MFPSLNLFGKEISLYMIMSVLGALAVAVMVHFTTKNKPGYRRDQWLHLLLAAAGGVLIGARLLFFITQLPTFWKVVTHWGELIHDFNDFLLILQILFGGMVYYGGLFGGLVGAYLYCRSLKMDFSLHLDAAVPGIPLFHAFGRVGCLLAGCCYGVESSCGVYFPYSPIADPHVRYFPIQLVEAAVNLLLAVFLLVLPKKYIPKGKRLWVYFFLYGIARFIIEFWRGDATRGIWFGLSTSQWISLALIAASLTVWITHFWKIKKNSDPQPNE